MGERAANRRVRKLPTTTREAKSMACKGWNFHVFCLGADRCSICGAKR